jgi:hypothetical protein
MRKANKAVAVAAWVIIILLFISAGFAIGSGFVGDPSVYFVFMNVMSISYVLMGALICVFLCKNLGIIGISLILANCTLSIGQLYFLEYRAYHRLLIILFAVSVVYSAICLIYYIVTKRIKANTENMHLIKCVIPVAFIGGSLLIKTLFLLKRIETEMNDFLTPIVIIALGAAALALIIGAVLIKDRSDKKEYAGKLAAVFSLTFFLVFGLPALSAEYTNYAFDTSVGEVKEYVVIDKYTRNGGRGGPHYHLVLRLGEGELDITTENVIYSQYEKGEAVRIYEYNGAFGYRYYEYRFEGIYRYDS